MLVGAFIQKEWHTAMKVYFLTIYISPGSQTIDLGTAGAMLYFSNYNNTLRFDNIHYSTKPDSIVVEQY